MNGTVAVDRSAIKLSMPEKTPEKPWTNLFATNRMAARGINLTCIAPIIIDGEKVVEILAEDLAKDDVKWKPSVVVYVVGTAPSIGVMERFILGQGNFSSKPVVLYHADGYFVVRFANEEERDRYSQVYKDGNISSMYTWHGWYAKSGVKFQFTAVYGLHTIATKSSLWENIKQISTHIREPWLIMGDFNSILAPEDRPIGSQVQLAEIKDFKDCMINSNLSELHTVGRQYIWTNGHVFSRIDRALVNDEWVLRMPPVQVMVMEPLFSDLTSEYRIGSTKGHKKETIQ
ncbi:hypothetical protein H5410_065051 [Solanum commersonii]|uniref:Endonuclease/exonuclease/phosphatase domain-containing protein n=1 Tax=Solanum commersonii TaxID=4109 RepID=A0A9J5VXM2_SOLCO|nr:hypothetical protein H5410_065051 [Solanum commersonii]